ncbi:hypothetical protein HZQ94_10460 [Elizabethkingia anophelis]|jgi:hypothetical protein|uniref:hypothetical protein n=1 Tax=Elizabethkingia anophelis TaxID=1117645 RepID=UPI0021A752D4|nr:hypothetical protein [Elizabethkingia anophelis]MCT3680819.1 hypothetical protein [Elizabethkingia anophelis]
MDKPTKKRNNYNEGILIVLKEKYGYSIDYIRKSLRGDRVGEMPDLIKKDYSALEKEATKAIKEKAEHLKTTI